MRSLYLDISSGISGDMALSCLFSLGADISKFSKVISKVIGKDVQLSLKKVSRNGIEANQLDIQVDISDEKFRHLSDIKKMINSSDVSDNVKHVAIKTFDVLAEAESQVHGIPIEDVHFHEIGAVDTIIDILGFAWCLSELNIDRVISSSVTVGKGKILSAHGVIPLPAPATLNILKGVPVLFSDIEGELTTPTGAAIIKANVSSFSQNITAVVEDSTFATGTKEFQGATNLLRAMIFKEDSDTTDEIILIETNIDNMTGEAFGFLLNKLMSDGALDVTYTSAYGKKNRPLYILTVMIKSADKVNVINTIFKFSQTAGLRLRKTERIIMNRNMTKVNVEGEDVNVKHLWYGDIEKFSPEWDDCVKVAKKVITTPTDIQNKAMNIAQGRSEC